MNELFRGYIKGRTPGKLTGCERDLAINLPGCFTLLTSFIRKTKNAWLKNPTVLLHKNLMKPLIVAFHREDNMEHLLVTAGGKHDLLHMVVVITDLA